MCPHASVTFAVMSRFGVTTTGGNEGEDVVTPYLRPSLFFNVRRDKRCVTKFIHESHEKGTKQGGYFVFLLRVIRG